MKWILALAVVIVGVPGSGVAVAQNPSRPGDPRYGFPPGEHHGRLGVLVNTQADPETDSIGAHIEAVTPGSPAAKAGLKAGDVVTKIDGVDVAASIDLSSRIAALKPGAKAKLEVWRDGRAHELVATVGEIPVKNVAAAEKPDLSNAKLGVAVRSLGDQERQGAGVDGGLLVEDVGGPAEKAGIRPGDIILSANGTALKSPEELKAAAEHAGKSIALLVQRNDVRTFVAVELG